LWGFGLFGGVCSVWVVCLFGLLHKKKKGFVFNLFKAMDATDTGLADTTLAKWIIQRKAHGPEDSNFS